MFPMSPPAISSVESHIEKCKSAVFALMHCKAIATIFEFAFKDRFLEASRVVLKLDAS